MVSSLSYGSWITLDSNSEETQKRCMYAAYDAGINFFDNAKVYANGESEVVMGRILKQANWSRDTYSKSTTSTSFLRPT